MKSIAEYFRDLAADDRYFGAEPPQPDAQMLHQIAEREVKRKVEARVQKNGVVLRQTADAVGGDALPPAPAERPPEQNRAAPGDDRRPSRATPDHGDNTPFEVDIDGDSVAAKLSRIRAVVARARANRDTDTAFTEDEPVEPYLTDNAAPLAIEDAPLSDDADDFASETPSEDDSEPPVSLADMLADDAIEEDALDAKEAEEAAAAEETRIAKEAEEAVAAEQARIAKEAEEAAAAEQARIAREAEEAAAVEQARLAKEADEAAAAEQARIAREAEEAETLTAKPHTPIARVIKLKRTEFEAALAAGDIEEVEDDDLGDDDMVAEIEVDGDDEDLSSAADTPDDAMVVETIAAALADEADEHGNVFAEAESDADNLDEIDDADDSLTEGIRDLIGETSLGFDDEADLAAELAEVERDAAEAEAAKAKMRYSDMMEDGEDEAADDAPAEDGDEQALNRLLDETNAKLSETEGSRRRSAIAHLKAAVAATKADRLLKGNRAEPAEDESLNRYRDDLAQVVRPRRPVAAPAESGASAPGRERPSDPLAKRPAPLVLVSEQRIDKPAETTTRPVVVRPRRVSTTRPAPVSEPVGAQSETVSFSDFAAERGAEELPDILEAAVAYSAKYEGQSELSRPQILRRAAALRPDLAESREKGLQSFGQLLRSGRIRKVGAGQFSLNETAEQQTRAAGQ